MSDKAEAESVAVLVLRTVIQRVDVRMFDGNPHHYYAITDHWLLTPDTGWELGGNHPARPTVLELSRGEQ